MIATTFPDDLAFGTKVNKVTYFGTLNNQGNNVMIVIVYILNLFTSKLLFNDLHNVLF